MVDSAEWGDINGLPADSSSRADTGAVFAGAAVYDGVNGNLDGVLVGHDVNLEILGSAMPRGEVWGLRRYRVVYALDRCIVWNLELGC